MFEEKLERSGIHCAGGSSDLLDATRQTPDYATLEVLAKHIHMNPFHFSSYFKKQVGQNFKDYLNRVRMEDALELLLNSDKHSYEIAEEVGFKDYRYFNEVFSRYYGKTPAAYRKSFKEPNNG